MRNRVAVPALLALLASATAAAAETPPSPVFDRPLASERVDLGSGSGKRVLSCFYFPGLRVKQLDTGEVGAAELAILPRRDTRHIACRTRTEAGEIVIPADKWSGYFKGVKAGYVFFDAEDGTNGGLGFAVFDGHSGAKLFEDLAVGDIRSAEPVGGAIRLRYRRALPGACSVPRDGVTCWASIAAKIPGAETAAAPDCAAGYLKAKTDMARGRCEAQNDKRPGCFAAEMKRLDQQRWDDAPSVIGLDVEAEITGSRQSVKALGAAQSCWPSD